MNRPKIKMDTIVLECKDITKLADFYSALLGWEKTVVTNDWITIYGKGETAAIGFQQNDLYISPVWPEEHGAQQMMARLDFSVIDLAESVEYATSLGAEKAKIQYYPDQYITMLDPAGHPFCLCLDVN